MAFIDLKNIKQDDLGSKGNNVAKNESFYCINLSK